MSARMMTDWLQIKMKEHESMPTFFESTLHDEAKLTQYLAFLETTFAPVENMTYVMQGQMLAEGHGVILRPWHLTWKPDAGFKGYVDPDALSMICELIVCNGFLTNPNLGGVEKLCCSLPVYGMMHTRPQISASEVSASTDASKLVDPLGLLFVKGWMRSLAATVSCTTALKTASSWRDLERR